MFLQLYNIMYVKGKWKKQKNKASTLYESLKCIVLPWITAV